jgi:hypothetical protein
MQMDDAASLLPGLARNDFMTWLGAKAVLGTALAKPDWLWISQLPDSPELLRSTT